MTTMQRYIFSTRPAAPGASLPFSNDQLLNFFISTSILLLIICLIPATAQAQQHRIDFESLTEGQQVNQVSSDQGYAGIEVNGAHDSCPLLNAAIVYDSNCSGGCTGDDYDLGTPNNTFGGPGIGEGGESGSAYENAHALGNLLIIHHSCNDMASPPVEDPRDYGGGAVLTFTFPTPVTISSMTLIDVDSYENLTIEYLDASGASLGSQVAPATGDNGVVQLAAALTSGDTPSGVTSMVLTREGSGAIDNITFIPEVADLSITADVNNPAPDIDEEVSFSLLLKNDGPDNATNVAVEYFIPEGLSFVPLGPVVTSDAGSTVTWTVGDLAVGDSLFYTFQAIVDVDTTMEMIAQVSASDQWDPDSTPGNDVPSEDDQDHAVVTPGESSGGGDGGIESEGNMATALARRLFHRRIDAQEARALHQAPETILFAATTNTIAGKSSQGSNDLITSIPEEGPLGTLAYEVTPEDLLDITNATSVVSVDYLQLTGRRLGAIFSTLSPSGELYDHSKTSCDRLGGGQLRDVRLVHVAGHPFVMSTLIHPDNSVDYSISFVAYRSGNTYTIDSHFTPDEYDIPAQTDEVLNLQVWGVAPSFTESLTADLLTGLAEKGNLVFENDAEAAPSVFVVDGSYQQGTVSLRFVNRVGSTDVTVRGSIARTEADAASNIRTPFEETVTLTPSIDGSPYSTIDIPMGALFDIILFVDHEPSKSFDQLYHADGAWSFSSGNASQVNDFRVGEHVQVFANNTYAVERSGSLKGQVTDWASLFKYLRPNGQAVDLSVYSHISFMAWGEGQVRMVIEKAGIEDWDQYGYTFTLTPEKNYYRIPFKDLKKETTHAGPMTAEDVTLVAFYAIGDGLQSSSFSMNFEQMAFGGAKSEDDPELPLGYALDQNFPNPFNPTTQFSFSLDEPMHVKVSIVDMLGREVQVLMDGLQPEGETTVTFEAANLPSGLYLYRLETPRGNTARIMSLLK